MEKTMKRVLVSLLLSTALAQPAELPVKQVVLYKHGVGFFERSGRLGAGESARLDFNASEMNDVLKSLTIDEKGGGKISGLRYDSMDPLSHKLAEFPFKIGEGQPLSGTIALPTGWRPSRVSCGKATGGTGATSSGVRFKRSLAKSSTMKGAKALGSKLLVETVPNREQPSFLGKGTLLVSCPRNRRRTLAETMLGREAEAETPGVPLKVATLA